MPNPASSLDYEAALKPNPKPKLGPDREREPEPRAEEGH